MGKSFYQKRAERELAKKKAATEKRTVEELIEAVVESNVPTVEAEEPVKVQIYSEADMTEITKLELAHKAHNVYFDKKEKCFMLVTLTYSPLTGEAKVISVERFSDNIIVAARRIGEMFSIKLFKKEEEL